MSVLVTTFGIASSTIYMQQNIWPSLYGVKFNHC